MTRPGTLARLIAFVALTGVISLGTAPPEPARATATAGTTESVWDWPIRPPFAVTRDYIAPAHAYAAGHRGIDIRISADSDVRAPDDGVVAFAGWVVDRAVITIDHGGGIVSTLEPVDAIVAAGDRVRRGEIVGALSLGGHAAPGSLHLGARLAGEYLNPLVLLGAMPRAVLLPYAGQ